MDGPKDEVPAVSLAKRGTSRFVRNIYDAIRLFKGSRFMQEVMGEEVHSKFAEIKLAQAERCPKALGTQIKASEVQYHHEFTEPVPLVAVLSGRSRYAFPRTAGGASSRRLSPRTLGLCPLSAVLRPPGHTLPPSSPASTPGSGRNFCPVVD